MFTLPSIWNIIISTAVFFISVWYIRNYLDRQAIPKSMTRSLLVFVLASFVSWGAGALVYWTQEKLEGPKPAAQTSDDMLQLLKELHQEQH